MCSTKLLILFLTVLWNRTEVLSFNIETRNPIVKKGAPGSYFGFSVAQHAVHGQSRSQEDFWLLVGAPLGTNLQPGTNRSGALFKCPISQKDNDCVQVETDGRRLDELDYDYDSQGEPGALKPPGTDEIKDDQWLGVTVKSQKPGGIVVVCAHRYIQSQNLNLYHYGMGLCYLLNSTLLTVDALQPCKGQPMEKLHQQFGYCQVGTSLAVLDDGYTLMGAPGPYTWRGTIFAKSMEGDFFYRDNTLYKGPLSENPTPINKYSYLGMSVTGGHFFDKTTFNYVSGAPRSNFTGQVFLFDRIKSQDTLSIRMILNGTQFASSFGYEVLSVDIDQDGFDELLVAAPFFYEENKGGAVYIFNNLNNSTLCNKTFCKYSKVLTGPKESRFGFSMTSLGDINKDGYTDVAIGAPYESYSGGAKGAVYVYLGGPGRTLNSEPSQIIKAPSLKTVGYSMSGGLDMDLNDYPDLLMGAFESDRVILYKTRPIIDINITVEGDELNNINVSRKGCSGDSNSNKTCFSFKTCFTLSKFRLTEPIDIKYDLKEVTKKIPRVSFTEEYRQQAIRVSDNTKKYCVDETAYLSEGTGDIITPIKFQVNFSMYNDSINSPILNRTSVKNFEATFQKNCGDDDVCYSHLTLTAGTSLNKTEDAYMLDMGKNKELILDVNVVNSGESAYEAKVFIMHPEGLSYIALQTEHNQTSNTICTANNESTLVTCYLGNPFPEKHSLNLRLRFEVSDIKKQQLEIKVSVNSTSKELSRQTSQLVRVILQKIASFVIKGEGKPQNIFYAGEIKGQSAMKYLNDIGPRVVHSYEVINQGEWKIRNMKVVILWPYQVYTERKEGGKWLLYLESEPRVEMNNTCVVEPSSVINPLNLNSSGRVEEFVGSEEHFRRRKRDVADVVRPERLVAADGKERKIVTMDCTKNTALCATITCHISQLNENSQIKINISARVWNSTLVEDYDKVDWVSMNSVAMVEIDDPTVTQSNNTVNITNIETKAYPKEALDAGVNIWIIVGAVIAGLILLILVIFLLYKCGFFKRNRIKDHTLSANLKRQGESENLLKDSDAKAKPAKKS